MVVCGDAGVGKSTLLQAAAEDYLNLPMDNGNVRNAVKGVLFPRRRRGDDGPVSLLSSAPFEAGFPTLIGSAVRVTTCTPTRRC